MALQNPSPSSSAGHAMAAETRPPEASTKAPSAAARRRRSRVPRRRVARCMAVLSDLIDRKRVARLLVRFVRRQAKMAIQRIESLAKESCPVVEQAASGVVRLPTLTGRRLRRVDDEGGADAAGIRHGVGAGLSLNAEP